MSEGYQGWSNYETWNINLWVSNDQGLHEQFEEQARELLEEHDFDRDEATGALATSMEEYFDEQLEDISAGPFSDIVTHALGKVDWSEIAKTYIDEIEIWSAGSNTPGCMPDSDPAYFFEQRDAITCLVEIMDQDAFDLGAVEEEVTEQDQEKIDALTAASEALANERGEYSQIVAGRCYFVGKL